MGGTGSLSLIVAMDRNRLIGRENHIPWHIPEDLSYFRKKTLGYNVIMGKNTWLSLGKVLDQRTNIVLSQDHGFSYPGIVICNSLEETLLFTKDSDSFVIGGAKIFQLFLPHVSKMFITKIEAEYEGDTFFPEIDLSDWKQVFYEQMVTSNGIQISFNEYVLG